jgi:hypothetical protein
MAAIALLENFSQSFDVANMPRNKSHATELPEVAELPLELRDGNAAHIDL